jgi:hypothetical protein
MRTIHHHYTKEKEVLHALYHPLKKIRCLCETHYGHHTKSNTDNSYAYSIVYTPI